MGGNDTTRQLEMVEVAHGPPPSRVQVEAQEGPRCGVLSILCTCQATCGLRANSCAIVWDCYWGLLASRAQPFLLSQNLHFKRIPEERQGTVSSSRNIGNFGQDL